MIVDDIGALKKRINRFLDSRKYDRGEVSNFIDLAREVGSVAIFGGMLRDLCIGGNRFFDSDVDLVFEQQSKSNIESLLDSYKYEINSFGGYRVHLRKWQIDIWALENTWAFKNGLVKNNGFKSLLETTFFNWDAIVYEINSKSISVSQDYFDVLKARYLDINLLPNCNEVGSTVRTLRMMIKLNAKLSPRLRDYLYNSINLIGYETLIDWERRKYKNCALDKELISYIFENIELHKSLAINLPFEVPSKQYLINL